MDKYTALFARHIQRLTTKGTHNEVQGLCPFHKENTPSWNGNRETGLYHCFSCGAEGNADQFAKRLGDTEWIPEKQPPPKNPWQECTIVDTYDYPDETGVLLYQNIRFQPKAFRPRVPLPGEGWNTSPGCMEGVRRVLFRLPQLSSLPQGSTIYVVEGEEDVKALEKWQLIATTICGGSQGTLELHMLEPLKGQHVVILPDNDTAGRTYGQRMVEALSSLAASVRCVELPALPLTEDVRWWIDHGHTIEELRDLEKKAPIIGGIRIWEPVMQSFDKYEEKELPYLWYPYLPIGRITMLEGDPGQGKSWFALAVASCASRGTWMDVLPTGGSFMEPAGVIYITSEDDPEDTIVKRLRILQADKSKIHYVAGKAKGNEGKIAITFADIPMIARAIERANAKLVIVDPIQAYLPTNTDMNKAQEVRRILDPLADLAQEKQCAILLLRHLAKGNKDNALYRGMGSVDWTGKARSVLFCGERRELRSRNDLGATRRVAVAHVKTNNMLGPSVEFELSPDQFLWVGTSDISTEQILLSSSINLDSLNEAKELLLSILHEDGLTPMQVQKNARAAGISMDQIHVAKNALGITRKQVYGQWRWVLPKPQTAQN